MVKSAQLRALRALIVACAWPGSDRCTSNGRNAAFAGTCDPDPEVGRAVRALASSLTGGGLYDKWQGDAAPSRDELVQLALFEGDPDRCASPAALQFLPLSMPPGFAKAAPDRRGQSRGQPCDPAGERFRQYGQIDVWSSPLATLARGGGDCEDYAIAKYVALRLAGIAPEDCEIVVMHDTIHGEDHAVAGRSARWPLADAG